MNNNHQLQGQHMNGQPMQGQQPLQQFGQPMQGQFQDQNSFGVSPFLEDPNGFIGDSIEYVEEPEELDQMYDNQNEWDQEQLPDEGDFINELTVETSQVLGENDGFDDDDDDDDDDQGFQLDDFVRAKEFFMQTSEKSGISLYEHFSDLIRKLLDQNAPTNPVDFIEEMSMNVKRYRFRMNKDVNIDDKRLSKRVLDVCRNLGDNWKQNAQWSSDNVEILKRKEGESMSFGGFPNLLRLLYYLEQVGIGLPREEMFKLAFSIRQLAVTHPNISRVRFFGKVFGRNKNYYVAEAEIETELMDDLWKAQSRTPSKPNVYDDEICGEDCDVSCKCIPCECNRPGASYSFERAVKAVTDPEILKLYSSKKAISGIPPVKERDPLKGDEEVCDEEEVLPSALQADLTNISDSERVEEQMKWQEFQLEMMNGFPVPVREEGPPEVPKEEWGKGCNRRCFYVCNELDGNWYLLPQVTPQQINVSRSVRWALNGELGANLRTLPEFPGKEANYLRALLGRIKSGSEISPKGYFRSKAYDDFTDEEEGEDEEILNDKVYPNKAFRPSVMKELLNPKGDIWIHHVSFILMQGRIEWWNPSKDVEGLAGEDDESADTPAPSGQEFGPGLFSPVKNDIAFDGSLSFSFRASSSVFQEFQVVKAVSNLWPGSDTICTIKGKVESVYFGDGLKFKAHTYAPAMQIQESEEYKEGPELAEIFDPTVEDEQSWLAKLQLDEIGNVEEKFVDNEEEGGEEETKMRMATI